MGGAWSVHYITHAHRVTHWVTSWVNASLFMLYFTDTVVISLSRAKLESSIYMSKKKFNELKIRYEYIYLLNKAADEYYTYTYLTKRQTYIRYIFI